MPNNNIEEIFKDWKAQTLFVLSALTGFLALFVSGYIEYYFFKSVLQDATYISLAIVIVLESAKLCSIILHRFVENKQSRTLILPDRIIFLNRIARFLLIVFSLVCSTAKISEFMESPKLESMWKVKRGEIVTDYSNKYSEGKKLWDDRIITTKISIDTVTNQMNRALAKALEDLSKGSTDLNRNANRAKDNFTIQKYKDIAQTNSNLKKGTVEFVQVQYNEQLKKLDTTYQRQLKERDTYLAKIDTAKNKALSIAYDTLKNSMDVQSPLIVGIFTMFKKAGIIVDFKIFQARFVFIIALFTTLLLELIIMNTFNYLTLVFLLRMNKDDYDEHTYFPNRTSLWQRIKQAFRQ